MPSAATDSIRAGKGLLPKNIHWWIVGLVLAGIGLALYLNAGKQSTQHASQKQETERKEAAALVREKPDVRKLIEEGASQPQVSASKRNEPKVPSIEPKVSRELADQESAANGAEAARYTEGIKATSPIIVLTGEEDQAKRAREPTVQEQLLQNLSTPAPAPTLSPEDRSLLTRAQGEPGAEAPKAPSGPAYLSEARRNQAWLRQVSAESSKARPQTAGIDPPVSPYTVVEGTPIPAVIVSEIDSDLPGQIIARTTQDIYDSVSGRYLLVPAGSLVYGQYNNAVTVGQDRIAAVFDRIIFPNGAGVRLAAMPGAGSTGEAGMHGEVDNHFWKVFGSSMLIAGVAALFEPRPNVTNNFYLGGGTTGGGAVTDAAGQVIVDVTRQIESRNTTIPPTVRVKAGQRFTIIVEKDLALAPYGARAW